MLFLRSLSQRRIQETAATHAMTHMKGTPGACFPCVACHPRERAAIPEKRINSHTHKVSLPTRSLTNKHSQVRERESERANRTLLLLLLLFRRRSNRIPLRDLLNACYHGDAQPESAAHGDTGEHLVVVCLSHREEVTAALYSHGAVGEFNRVVVLLVWPTL